MRRWTAVLFGWMCLLVVGHGCHLASRYHNSASADASSADLGPGRDTGVDRGIDQRSVTDLVEGDWMVPSPGMVAHYRFDGDATDVINGYDGNPTAAVIYDANVKKSGQSAYFDGAAAYVGLPFTLSAELTQDWSIAFWIKSAQAPGYVGASFGSNDCTVDPLWIYGNGIVDSEMCGSELSDWGMALMEGGFLGVHTSCSGTSVTDGSWHHIVFTRHRASGDCVLYIDRTEALKSSCSAGEDYSDTLEIGVGNNSCDRAQDRRWFEGNIDELRFWNRVLTLAEIQSID